MAVLLDEGYQNWQKLENNVILQQRSWHMATAEKAIWFQSSREQLDALLMEVCEGLQLSLSRHGLAVERYGTVNEILEKAGSPFQFLRPRIFPHGSMALGTTCKPVEGPHDLDLSFKSMRLTGGGILSRGLVPCTNS